jgi:predicted ATPase
VEIDLGPLDRDDAASLVAAGASTPRDPEVVDRIVDLAQGNPFLMLELARSAVAGVPALVPTARDAVASRFVDLDEGTVALRRLALAGDDLDPAGVLALTGSSEAEAFALLDVALGAGALVVSGARYRFRHELVRQALVDQLPPHQWLAVHRDTARRLAGADAPPALIARHWLDGGLPDEAVDWLLAAARQAEARRVRRCARSPGTPARSPTGPRGRALPASGSAGRNRGQRCTGGLRRRGARRRQARRAGVQG